MGKYICDFDEIQKTINNLNSKYDELETALNNYYKDSSDALSQWSGDAKNAAVEKINNQIEKIEVTKNYIKQTSEFLRTTSQKIEEAENSLASLKI